MPEITVTHTHGAYKNWIEFFWDSRDADYWAPDSAWRKLEKFIGCKVSTGGYLDDKHFQRLEMLLSTHHRTFLTAYCIREGIKWK